MMNTTQTFSLFFSLFEFFSGVCVSMSVKEGEREATLVNCNEIVMCCHATVFNVSSTVFHVVKQNVNANVMHILRFQQRKKKI